MHLCSDEIAAFVLAVPTLRALYLWVKARVRRVRA